jgi:ubiquinone/menaquinone biosynthesis C-methylase UbiE
MTDSERNVKHENRYVIDSENEAEMIRLLDQDRMVTRVMGGLFPERSDLNGIERILDIGCGPGGWTQEVAFASPEIEIVGIDISQIIISYAQAQAEVQSLSNAHFQIMDATQPLAFADESFDMVNARFISGFMLPATWPQLLNECRRVLRPGGIIRLTEGESPLVNSPAYAQFLTWVNRAFMLAGRSFSPDGTNYGIVNMQPHFLRQAGFEQVQIMAHAGEFSSGTEQHHSFLKDMEAGIPLTQPFLLKYHIATEEELTRVYHEALAEVLSSDFCGLWFYLTAWGRKPESS